MSGRNVKKILALHDVVARAMADERFDDGRDRGQDLRQFIITWKWAHFEAADSETAWKLCCNRIGLKGFTWRTLLRADTPRFESPTIRATPSCRALMIRGPRAGEPCGKWGSYSLRLTDERTGEWEVASWCSRHQHEYRAARSEELVKRPPKPLPNVGGLLPSYIRATNWPDLYAHANHGTWEPPAIGIIADDWPVLEKVASYGRPKLAVLDGEAEDSETAAPRLRLVTS